MSSTKSLKDELFALKNRLEVIEEQLTGQSKEIEEREAKWTKLDPIVETIIASQGERVRLNIGGKIFSTSPSTLKSAKDSLLSKMVDCGKIDLSQEIFFDRSHRVFPYILEFLRFKTINYKRFNKDELLLLRDDAEYYGIYEILNYLDERLKDIKFIKFEFNGVYSYGGKTAGTNRLEDLSDKNLLTGICCNSPGKIVIELNSDFEFEEIDIGGWRGDANLWYHDNGAGAKIYTSVDNKTWKSVGSIPSGYGTAIKPAKLTRSTGRFIKFEYTSYLGIGYLYIKKIEDTS